MARALRDNLHEGDVFMDVGAHFGIWSVYAAQIVGNRGKIFAFEPSIAFDVLKENALLVHGVEVLRLGVGAQDRETTFFGQGNSSSGSFVEAVTNINQKCQPTVPVTDYKVKVRSLDSVVADLKVQPTLIKVDVEGFEFEVIRGAKNLIRDTHPSWLIEVHPPQLQLSGSSDEILLTHLKNYGYSIEVIDRNPNSLYTVLAQPCQRIKQVV